MKNRYHLLVLEPEEILQYEDLTDDTQYTTFANEIMTTREVPQQLNNFKTIGCSTLREVREHLLGCISAIVLDTRKKTGYLLKVNTSLVKSLKKRFPGYISVSSFKLSLQT